MCLKIMYTEECIFPDLTKPLLCSDTSWETWFRILAGTSLEPCVHWAYWTKGGLLSSSLELRAWDAPEARLTMSL